MSATEARAAGISASAVPGIVEVERIAAHRDPVVRNLETTQCYHQLSRALAERTGGRPANRFTFATWASKQASQRLRQEDLAARLVSRQLNF